MTEDDGFDRLWHRDEVRAAATISGQLTERRVLLSGDESPEQLADLLTEVERFEAAVAALGGDSIRNAPDSAMPEDRRLVLPARRDDESVGRYMARVAAAAKHLREHARGLPR